MRRAHHYGSLARRPVGTRESNLDQFLRFVWLPAIPLFAALIVVLAGVKNDVVASFLVATLIVCSVLLLAGLLRRGLAPDRIATVALVAAFVLWYAYPAFVDLFVLGRDPGSNLPLTIDSRTVSWSVLYLSLFLLTAVATIAALKNRQRTSPASNGGMRRTDARLVIALATLGCLIGVAPYFVLGNSWRETLYAIFQSRAIEKPWQQVSNLGDSTTPFTYLASSFLIGSTCLLWTVSLLDKSIRRPWRILLGSVALAISILIYFDQGTRSVFALMVLPPLTLSLMKVWQRSRFAASIGVLFALLVFIVMLQFQLLYRLDNTRTYLTEQFFEDWMTLGGTIDYFKETLLALRLVPTYHDYFRESVLVQFLVSPIPRFIWPEKPASMLVWFYTLWRWNIDIYQEGQGGNVFPGVVGQFYMSWGFFGPVIVGGLFGWMAVHIDRFIDKAIKHEDVYRAAIGAMLVIWVVVSFRVLSPGFFYPILVAVAIVRLSSLRVPAQARRDSGRRYRGTARAYLNENSNLRNRQNLVPESKGLGHENRD